MVGFEYLDDRSSSQRERERVRVNSAKGKQTA